MKVINILLILLYLSLTACGGGNPQPNPNPTPVSGVYFIADKDAPAFDELYITEVGQILPREKGDGGIKI